LVDAGFQTLIDAGRTDLSVESIAVSQTFRSLFTKAELEEAERRLASLPTYIARRQVPPQENFPDELDDADHVEGAARKVAVNYYERDSTARTACIKKYGIRCAVCGMSFEERYGAIGHSFTFTIRNRSHSVALSTNFVL
jgi:5-methylcytosine-specific restriction protein A